MSRPYAEAMVMRPAVTYNPYATSSKERTSDVITFAQFEERDLLSETRNETESGDESDSYSCQRYGHYSDQCPNQTGAILTQVGVALA